MGEAFKDDDPPIVLADLSTETGKNIQAGYRFLFMGAVRGIRNPDAHELFTALDAEEASRPVIALTRLLIALNASKIATSGCPPSRLRSATDALGYVSDDARQRTTPTGRRVRFGRSRPSRAKQLVVRLGRIKADLDSGTGDRQRYRAAKRMVHLRAAPHPRTSIPDFFFIPLYEEQKQRHLGQRSACCALADLPFGFGCGGTAQLGRLRPERRWRVAQDEARGATRLVLIAADGDP
jgi:hypothetical protein